LLFSFPTFSFPLDWMAETTITAQHYDLDRSQIRTARIRKHDKTVVLDHPRSPSLQDRLSSRRSKKGKKGKKGKKIFLPFLPFLPFLLPLLHPRISRVLVKEKAAITTLQSPAFDLMAG